MNIHVSNTGSLRENTDLSIMEQPLEWLQAFQENWLAHLEKTGETNWSIYSRVRNKFTPSGKAVRLKHSRLLFISSIGAYLPKSQPAFDEFNPLGDYSIRLIPSDTPLHLLDLANGHIDISAAQEDLQTLLPLDHLRDLVTQGVIGQLTSEFISFNGYHPHAIRVVKELVPTILGTVKELQADAALLIPVGALCVQSAGLIARALEMNGIATTIATNNNDAITLTAPPRAAVSSLPNRSVLGLPHNPVQQQKTLLAALSLLEKTAPAEFLRV
jgi:D-proline reductase (dithiol) PrdB